MKKILLAFFIISILASCGSSTKVVDHWKDPNLNEADLEELNSVMVAVLSPNESSRRSAEDKMAEINPAFVQSYMVLNKNISQDVETSKKVMTEKGFDGVLIFRLVSKEKGQSYVPGTNYGGYYGYHNAYWGGYYDDGYYVESTTYLVETKLFSIKQDKLLWSGITSTVDPSSVKGAMSEIAEAVYKQIKKDIEISNTTGNE